MRGGDGGGDECVMVMVVVMMVVVMMVVVSGVAFSLGEFVLVEKYLDLSPRVQGRGHRFEPPLMVCVGGRT